MKINYLSSLSLLATGAIALAATPAYSEANLSSGTTFFCETNNNTPTTLAKTNTGEVLPIFHWNEEALSAKTNLQEMCNEVSEKLENYLVAEEDLSSISFKSAKLDNIPAICLAGEQNDCNLLLLTLAPTEKPIKTANKVLESILDPKLQENKIVSNERGIQSTAYKINFWELLGFRF